MTRREKGWLALGILLGLIIAALTVVALYERPGGPRSASAIADRPPLQQTVEAPQSAETSVQLTDEEQKSIGVETSEVKRQAIRKDITAPGRVAEPETGIGVISARIGGRIDKLLINITGESVSKGQQVALIYSPEVFTAGEEYRLALENRQRLSASKEPQAISEAEELVRASRRRLELWGLTSEQIEEIASSSEKSIEIATYSSISGIVTKRNVTEGQYVKQGDVLFEVTDLGSVWVQADI